MPIPERVLELVARFLEHRDTYLDPAYKEARLRVEFLNPFFEALGWDISNRQGYSEAYKDVVIEDSVTVDGSAKAPDYAFRIGGQPKFYVEAKKPAINLKEDPLPALQLRRYAWTAGLSLSVLTDFEELAIYDTRIPPKERDAAHVARVSFFRLEEYAARWDELTGLLSKEAILRGAFDRYAASTRGKRGTAPVDGAILRQIESWRKELARDVAKRNRSLSRRELNYAVQQTLDRVLFLRISEGRGLEPFGALRDAAAGRDIYARLIDIFKTADNKYNSGLFHFRREANRSESPDTLTPGLVVSDQVLRAVISDLYWPNSPYVFEALPADILGQVYEQFLGKTIALNAQRAVRVEEKPEVRKAGGVYYTPTFVVDYIVHYAIGPLVLGKTPKEVSKLRIVDPACGSGSFLIQAYQFLLDWHLDWYMKNGPDELAKRKNPPVYQVRPSQWRLTSTERKRILLNNIFGVDIDSQAVEVTKLSLLLKVLEGETQASLSAQIDLLHERALPDLESNIKCGNSVIAPDYIGAAQFDLLDDDELERVNVFNWADAFPEIMRGGGFDAVIGNPPYVLLQVLDQPTAEAYLKQRYKSARYKIDTYHVFMEQGINLLREGGRLGYITPTSFLRNKYAQSLRSFILEASEVDTLRVFLYPVFRDATVDTCITILSKAAKPNPNHLVHIVRSTDPNQADATTELPQATWREHPKLEFGLISDANSAKLLAKIASNAVPLGDFATAYFGIQTFNREKYVATQPKNATYRPVIDGANISRYGLTAHSEYVDARPKAIKSGGNGAVYAQDRIGVRQIGEAPIATLLPGGLLTLNTIYNIYFDKPTRYSLPFVLAVINSSVVQWYWREMHFDQKRRFPKIKKDALLSIPIPKFDLNSKSGSEAHDDIADRAQALLALAARIQGARAPGEREQLERRFKALDELLDRAVAALFGLDENELSSLQRGAVRIA
jgi:hypothetical protein